MLPPSQRLPATPATAKVCVDMACRLMYRGDAVPKEEDVNAAVAAIKELHAKTKMSEAIESLSGSLLQARDARRARTPVDDVGRRRRRSDEGLPECPGEPNLQKSLYY